MASPRAVVIPFGVPDDGRGLGLGLAALVHSFAQIDGESVALAQLLARKQQPSDHEDEDEEAAVPDEQVMTCLRGQTRRNRSTSAAVCGPFQ